MTIKAHQVEQVVPHIKRYFLGSSPAYAASAILALGSRISGFAKSCIDGVIDFAAF